MRYSEFVDHVRDRAALDGEEKAETIVHATLETLGERTPKRERHLLESQLPNEMKQILDSRKPGESYSLEEFYTRVGARSGLRYSEAVKQARAVGFVLTEAVSPGEVEHVVKALSPEYAELFGKEPEGPESPSWVG